MANVEVIIPFRDRGIDPRRQRNLMHVLKHWERFRTGRWSLVDDSGHGDEQFNRSRAYNQAIGKSDAEVFVLAEADMLISLQQVKDAVDMAAASPGLVVPFTEYRYLSEANSEAVRTMGIPASEVTAKWVKGNGSSIGAINVVSRATMESIGQFDESFEGNWYDDDAMKIAFETCAGPTRWVEGPAHHLYHLPGWKGGHLTEADRHATRRNKIRLYRYQKAQTPARIRELTAGGS